MKQFTLPKSERLYLRNAISELFAKGSSFTVFPYRITYRVLPEDDPQEARVAIMTVAPKKRFKHAVDRNHMKRIMREAYRLAKPELIAKCEEAHCKLAFAMIYVDNKFISFHETQEKMQKIFHNLEKKLE
ncbi:MAG: ribonuclease P protein component [Bacteroidales bacterium]|nr:ribonuclease P protein component [Bacteroidales bacterium]